MAITRTQKKDRFSIIELRLIESNELSALAKIILIFAISRPDNWVFNVQGIVRYVKEGPDAVRRALSELAASGYLVRVAKRVNGKFAGYEYHFYEHFALNHDFHESNRDRNEEDHAVNLEQDYPDAAQPFSTKPQPDFPHTENHNIHNINHTKNNKNNINSINNPSINPHEVEERIKAKLEIECLAQEYDKRYLEDIVSLIADIYITTSPTIQLNKDSFLPVEYVRERFDHLNALHIELILRSLERANPTIRNMRNYLLTSLINAANVSNLSFGYGDY